jgi:hypothetical protein
MLLLPGCLNVSAQEKPPLGSLEVAGRVKISGETVKLERKRFYLFRGGLEENKVLVEKLRTADFISRDCFYSQASRPAASSQLICWLKTNACESPYCRKIVQKDLELVPEFQAAYQKSLRQFRRPEVAQDWLTTNLPPDIRDGFYRRQKSFLANLLGDLQPLQSVMTDSVSVKGLFIDIPLNLGGKKTEKFFVSNLLPIELGEKGYIWVCQIDVGASKKETLNLSVTKNCEMIAKKLPVCTTEKCP